MRYGDDVRVIINESECNVDFLHLYNRFVEAKGHTGPMSAESFRRLRPLTDISIAYYQESPLVAHMLLKDVDAGRVRSLYLASERLEDDESAKVCSILSGYLHWYEIEHYKTQGFSLYDLGGIPSLDHPRTILK